MIISIANRISLFLRKIPVGEVVRCLKKAKAGGITLELDQIQTHFLCGGHLNTLVDGLIFAKQNGIDASWKTISMLDLAGREIAPVMKECVDTRTVRFSTYTPDGNEVIRGFCSDGQPVRAALAMDFKLPLAMSDPETAKAVLEQVQERLATRTSTYIYTSPDFGALSSNRLNHESELVGLAAKSIPTTEGVRIEYEKV
ncbi:MAG: flotillin-like FloA family protein [Pontiellaceae bacterium]|nr:flotillin-like FloA family protein [Pontiellaceae bacterium]